jgi:hypothetical protein
MNTTLRCAAVLTFKYISESVDREKVGLSLRSTRTYSIHDHDMSAQDYYGGKPQQQQPQYYPPQGAFRLEYCFALTC